jgi:hypothetical protein
MRRKVVSLSSRYIKDGERCFELQKLERRRNKMKRIVAVAIMAVLACVLFLVPYASAAVEITCSVYPEEADFKSDFVYNITLTNFSFMAIGNLSLKVGSDSDKWRMERYRDGVRAGVIRCNRKLED